MPRTSPVVALVGKDSFLQLDALRAFAQQLGDPQRTDLDGADADPRAAFDDLRTPSMFGGPRLVVVRDGDAFVKKHRDALEAYCEHPGTEGTLVLRLDALPKNQRLYKAIDKLNGVVECEPPKGAALAKWARERAATHEAKMEMAAADALVDLLGGEPGRIDSEIAKIALGLDEGTTITEEHVRANVAFARDQQLWEMTDALTMGRPDEAIRRWRQLQQTDPTAEFRAVTWLALWLDKASRAFALAQKKVQPFAIAKELKIWPAKNVDALLQAATQLGPTGLRAATDRLAEVDLKNKSSVGTPAANVELFLASLT